MKKILLLLVAIAWTSTSCEKDDICDTATATTPRLVIDFYDVTNPTLTKSVTNLALIAEGHEDEPIIFNGVNQITVPLKTTQDSTKYRFVLNYDSASANDDYLEFHYIRTNVYVSRACGFKTIFTFAPENPYLLSDAIDPPDFWIKGITIVKPIILNENEAHIKITF